MTERDIIIADELGLNSDRRSTSSQIVPIAHSFASEKGCVIQGLQAHVPNGSISPKSAATNSALLSSTEHPIPSSISTPQMRYNSGVQELCNGMKHPDIDSCSRTLIVQLASHQEFRGTRAFTKTNYICSFGSINTNLR